MGLKRIQHGNRPVTLPFDEATPRQIKEVLGIPQDRTLAIRTEDGLVELGDNERTAIPDDAEIIDVPFHEYGASREVAARLALECLALSDRYGQEVTFGYDPIIRRWWVRLPALNLPDGWKQRQTPVLVTVSDLYPMAAPDGFLISNRLVDRWGKSPAHFYGNNGQHEHLTNAGYGWFCLHPKGWKGDHDYRDGDSIAKYFALIEVALAHVVQAHR